jgi:DNA-directed RNA polymerase alpha subunit
MAKTRIPLDHTWETKQQQEKLLQEPIASLELGVRTINALEEDGILYVHELVGRTRKSLLRITNFGETTVIQVEKVLKGHGLSLKD